MDLKNPRNSDDKIQIQQHWQVARKGDHETVTVGLESPVSWMLRLGEHETMRTRDYKPMTLEILTFQDGNRLQCKNMRFLFESNPTLHLCLLIKISKNMTWVRESSLHLWLLLTQI